MDNGENGDPGRNAPRHVMVGEEYHTVYAMTHFPNMVELLVLQGIIRLNEY